MTRIGRQPTSISMLEVRLVLYPSQVAQGGDPNYIAPLRIERMKFLNMAKNAALAQLPVKVVVASVGGRDVGRITAHIDRVDGGELLSQAALTRGTGWLGRFLKGSRAVADDEAGFR